MFAALLAVPALRVHAAGSGHDMFSLPQTAAEVVALTGKASPSVLYLGTASYDNPAAAEAQLHGFADSGCAISNLSVSYLTPTNATMRAAVAAADIILVSGGNTLFATDRWRRLGLDALVKQSDAVLAGGSAGGCAWFDGCASDSMDPRTYKNPPGPALDPSLNSTALAKLWSYIRVPALGVLPGLFCPHYDIVESNGELRATMFTNHLQHHTGEYGLAIDNWAALVVEDGTFTIVSRAGKPGSVAKDGTFTANFSEGRPGAWSVAIDGATGALLRTLVPASGRVSELLKPARYIAADAMLPVARVFNPDDGRAPTASITECLY